MFFAARAQKNVVGPPVEFHSASAALGNPSVAVFFSQDDLIGDLEGLLLVLGSRTDLDHHLRNCQLFHRLELQDLLVLKVEVSISINHVMGVVSASVADRSNRSQGVVFQDVGNFNVFPFLGEPNRTFLERLEENVGHSHKAAAESQALSVQLDLDALAR